MKEGDGVRESGFDSTSSSSFRHANIGGEGVREEGALFRTSMATSLRLSEALCVNATQHVVSPRRKDGS